MKRVVVLGVVLAVGLVMQGSAAQSRGPAKVLEFDTMAGVSGPYVSTPNPIRGVNGGGLPWQIAKGAGELRVDGRLAVAVEGLVLSAGPLAGTDPIANFKAIVSCQTIVGTTAATSNVSTSLFPATATGDSTIETTVTLPTPCFAPIVFVTSPGGAWFAVTGV